MAAQEHRIVLTHDRDTMIHHFRQRMATGRHTPGLFILPQRRDAIGEVIESLLLVWAASDAKEWANRMVYLPLR